MPDVRLIDANALIREARETHEFQIDLGSVSDVEYLIRSAPTIDAIPVEWLREKMRGYASTLKSTELKALVTVMQMWQKEQEAR